MVEFKKTKNLEVSGFNDGHSTQAELDQMKPNVKRMLRPHKFEAQFKGRQKIANLFARIGIYLHI